ncbi:MAG: hypothetical protein V1870_00210 [Candidatus Aenigmatarchaeota archaeon]
MNPPYFKRIDFAKYTKALGLKITTEEDWCEIRDGIYLNDIISKDESAEHNLTYIGLRFEKPTDGHYYKTQVDTIYFETDGQIEFSTDNKNKEIYTFSTGDAIQIPVSVVRKIIPMGKYTEIKLIVEPAFDPADEIHVYD